MSRNPIVALALCMASACATGASDATIDDVAGGDAGGDDARGADDGSMHDGAVGQDGSQALDAGSGDSAMSGDATSGSDSSSGVDSGVAAKPLQGEVLITEVMYNPAGTEPDSEWFELYNATASPRILDGLTLTDGAARTHTIGAGITIAPHAYAVFARLRATSVANGIATASILYEYGTGLTATTGIILANGVNGGLSLTDGSTMIAASPYGGFSLTATNATLELKTLTYAAESTGTSWCVAAALWAGSTTDKGTPGAAGDCP